MRSLARPRLAAPLAALLVALAAAPEPAVAVKRVAAEALKAARYLGANRLDEARPIIAELLRDHPTAEESRWLRGELALLEGDYAGALAAIDGLPDDAVAGNVGGLRRLAASTAKATAGFASHTSAGGHFVIRYAPGKEEAIAELAGEVLERAQAVLAEDLGFRPSAPIRVELLAAPAELAQVSTLTVKEIETTGTIALSKYNKLMVVTPRATVFGYPWMDTLVHEYVHHVVSALSNDETPVWLQEGLARFQQSRWRSAPTTALTAIDQHLLATALKQDDLISFDAMHPSMAKLPSSEAAALAFAEVNMMVGYLHAKTGYAGLRQVLDLIRQGKNARRAVGDVLGASWRDVEVGWKQYLIAAKLKPQGHLAARASGPRIRFKQGKGDSESVGVDQVASARARKLARLGGILRARGRTDAAVIEYEKARLAAPEDPLIGAKLSRSYLELGRHREAIAIARPLAAADENDAAPATTLGVAYLAIGDATAAALAFEAALRVSPFDPAVRCGLADAYRQTGRAPLAAREERACELVRQ
jgi:tetratricopeptide (TPR) repeat protein